MYAEIKEKNKILINRISDEERIILKDLVESSNANGASIKITETLDETGELGGIFLEVSNDV